MKNELIKRGLVSLAISLWLNLPAQASDILDKYCRVHIKVLRELYESALKDNVRIIQNLVDINGECYSMIFPNFKRENREEERRNYNKWLRKVVGSTEPAEVERYIENRVKEKLGY